MEINEAVFDYSHYVDGGEGWEKMSDELKAELEANDVVYDFLYFYDGGNADGSWTTDVSGFTISAEDRAAFAQGKGMDPANFPEPIEGKDQSLSKRIAETMLRRLSEEFGSGQDGLLDSETLDAIDVPRFDEMVKMYGKDYTDPQTGEERMGLDDGGIRDAIRDGVLEIDLTADANSGILDIDLNEVPAHRIADRVFEFGVPDNDWQQVRDGDKNLTIDQVTNSLDYLFGNVNTTTLTDSLVTYFDAADASYAMSNDDLRDLFSDKLLEVDMKSDVEGGFMMYDNLEGTGLSDPANWQVRSLLNQTADRREEEAEQYFEGDFMMDQFGREFR